jgi:hypothetical protein
VSCNQDKPWDYNWLSQNPNITWDFVLSNPDKTWNYDYLSENPNITWEIVSSNQEKPWHYIWLSLNPNITWNIIKSNHDKPWRYDLLSLNEMIKAKDEFITSYLQKWFSQSDLKRELMEKLWHPNNLERMQYNGFNIFDDLIIV